MSELQGSIAEGHNFVSKFALGEPAEIVISGEIGQVTAVCFSIDGENSFHLHYRAADGRACDGWFNESRLRRV